MRSFVIITAVVLIACGQNSSGKKKEPAKEDTANTLADTAKTTTSTQNVPAISTSPGQETVNERLKVKYGNKWHVLNDKEATWMKDAFDYFIVPKRKDDPDYPYIAKGDYNADGKMDMAAVVTDSSKSNYQLAILLGDGNIMLWKEDIMEDAALSTTHKSEIMGMDGEKTKKVKLKADGINVEYFEKAAFVVYWDGRSFKRLQTAD